MIVLVAGVAGSGKSTVGKALAGRLGWAFEDGDALHPPANLATMRSGNPLTDTDRLPWLRAVGAWMDACRQAGGSAVVACSALKRSYRDLLRAGRPELSLVLLDVPAATLAARLAARHGHFFPRALLDSQLADLEPVQAGEPMLVVHADAPAEAVTDEIIRRLGLAGTATTARDPAGPA